MNKFNVKKMSTLVKLKTAIAVSTMILLGALCYGSVCNPFTVFTVSAEKNSSNSVHPLMLKPSDEVFTSLNEFPKRGGAIDWGLALSGGGIRSAAYSVGALKALYDVGLLKDIDVISSVSGGGFASYWIYSNFYMSKNQTPEFGAAALEDSAFVKNVCLLQKNGDFMSISKALKAFLQSKQGAFSTYQGSIERTFGNDINTNVKLDYLSAEIAATRAPYFIINTTQWSRKWDGETNIFELTPTYMGCANWGKVSWGVGSPALPLNKSIAVSAAAIKSKLGQEINNVLFPEPASNLWLSDGGHKENLAAFGLITRGMPNVIIVDAEFDSKYEFGSYQKLVKLLNLAGFKLNVKEIDDFIKKNRSSKKRDTFEGSSVCIGRATSNDGNKSSKIFYIKMALTPNVKQLFKDKKITDRGKAIDKVVEDAFYKHETQTCDCYDRFKQYPKGIDEQSRMYAYITGRYSGWLNGRIIWRLLNYRFPQTTTNDQSYYTDQFDAFIGLGYLETLPIKSYVKQ